MLRPDLVKPGLLLQITRAGYTLWDLERYNKNNPAWTWPKLQKATGKPPSTKDEKKGTLPQGSLVRVEEVLFSSDKYQALHVTTESGERGFFYSVHNGEESARIAGVEIEIRAGETTQVAVQLAMTALGRSLRPAGGPAPAAPEDEEIRRRRELARAYGGPDLSDQYPIAEIEKKYGIYGAIVSKNDKGAYRWRCQPSTKGYTAVDVQRTVTSIPWTKAAYHVNQVAQGDFIAPMNTPVSILFAEGGRFWIDEIYSPAKFVVSGVRIAVKFMIGGAWKRISFSHMSGDIPKVAVDAFKAKEPLGTGQVFGFISLTGNHWIGAPGEVNVKTGKGLPQPHAHVWFHTPDKKNDMDNHMKLAEWAKHALGYFGPYPNGGG